MKVAIRVIFGGSSDATKRAFVRTYAHTLPPRGTQLFLAMMPPISQSNAHFIYFRLLLMKMARTALLILCCFVVLSIACGFTFLPSSVSKRCSVDARTTAVRLSSEEEQNDSSSEPEKKEVVCPNCDLCDGSGRIAGGIGAVFPWIPIKAYKPCPNFGGQYERAGQGLDEIAFGRDSTFEK